LQSALVQSSIEWLDSILFMEFTYDTTKPNSGYNFTLHDNMTILFAASNTAEVEEHDDRNWAFLNLVNGTNAIPFNPCDCSSRNTIPNQHTTIFECPCSCVGFWQSPSCNNTNLTFAYTFKDGYGNPISIMHWKIFGRIAHFDVQSYSSEHWIGLGFSQSAAGNMVGSDAVIFGELDGIDQISPRKIIAASADGLQTAGAINITSTSYWRKSDGSVGMHFARELGFSSIGDGNNVYMVAVASTNSFPIKHNQNSRGASTINLETGGVIPPEFMWTTAATHGLLMYIAFVVCFPFGFLWARHTRNLKKDLWFEVHRSVQTIGFIIAMAGGSLAIGMVGPGSHFSTAWHAQTGFAALVGIIYQVSSAIMRPHFNPEKQPKSLLRILFEVTHRFVGLGSIGIAWAAIYGGLQLLASNNIFLYVHIAVIAAWLLIAFILEFRTITSKRRKYELINSKK